MTNVYKVIAIWAMKLKWNNGYFIGRVRVQPRTRPLESDDSTFIDYENEKPIRTLDEGRAYLDDYLSQAFDLEINQVKENKQLRKEIILHLRTHTGLSRRVIADLLGVDKIWLNAWNWNIMQAKEPSPCLYQGHFSSNCFADNSDFCMKTSVEAEASCIQSILHML